MFFYFIIYLWDVNWIKTFSIVIIKSENLDLKFNIYCIWTEKKSSGIKRNYKYLQRIKRQQNNNSLGAFNPVKLNHLKPYQTEIEKIVWIL